MNPMKTAARHGLACLSAFALLIASLPWFGAAAVAQEAFPERPIRILVGAPPGGGTDAVARVLADATAARLKQPVMVENRPGANGMIASEALVRSPADGYSIMVVQNTHTINPVLFKKVPYDVFDDFTPIGTLARSPLVLIASANTGVRSVDGLAALLKRDPKAASFGSSEASSRIAIEMIGDGLGVPLTVASYKGTGPTMQDIAGGHLAFTVTTIASTLPFKQSGKIDYVAVLAAQRSPFLPDVPTLAEQGLPGIESNGWWGVVGPAKLPAAIVGKLGGAIETALADPEVRRKLAALSVEPWVNSPERFDQFIRSDAASMKKLAVQAGIQPQ